MNNASNKILRGVYVIQVRWDLIWLYNAETKTEETIARDKLSTLMLQSFDYDLIEKFMEKLYDGDKFLVDFDKEKIKTIKLKDEPFENCMKQYFSAENVQQEIDNGYDLEDIYKKEETRW